MSRRDEIRRVAGFLLIVLGASLAACSGDFPGTISGSGSPDSSSTNSTGDTAQQANELLFQQGMTAFNAAEAAQQAGNAAEASVRFAEAQTFFDRIWAEYPGSIRHDNAGYLRGRCRYELGDNLGAVAALVEMRAAHPGSLLFDNAAYYTGRARFQLGQYFEAIADFQTSISAGPDGVYIDNAAYYVGRSYYEAGDLVNARANLGSFESSYPQSTFIDNGRYYLGRSYFDAGLFADSRGPFERVLLTVGSIYEDDARFYHARSFYELGDFATAQVNLAAFETSYPQSIYIDNARYYLGRSYFDAAVAAVAADPAGAAVLFSTSRAPFERVLLIAGSLFEDDASFYHARSFYEAGDLVTARAELAAFENAHPQSIYIDNSRYYLGRSFFDAGLYAEALGPFERVLLTAGSTFEDDARFYHGRCRFHLGDFSAAIPEFENLVALFPAGQYADNALLFEMRSHIALGSCPNAQTALTRLTTNYPASTFIAQAQQEFTAAGCP